MKIINNTYTLPPAGKRKHEIVFTASFGSDKDNQKLINENLAMYMGKNGLFD